MAIEKAREYGDQGDERRRDDVPSEAGARYVLSAYEYLGYGWDHAAIQRLVVATLCYRLAGIGFQVEFCKRLGAAICFRNYRTAVERTRDSGYSKMKPGVWQEFWGDLLLVGGDERWNARYESAIEEYQGSGDQDLSVTENEHVRLLETYMMLAKGAGYAEEYDSVMDTKMHYNEGTCSDLVELKRRRFPDYVETILTDGTWTWEDAD